MSELQNIQHLLVRLESDGITDISIARKRIADYMATSLLKLKTAARKSPGAVRTAPRRRPDNLTICSACGAPAVIIPLVEADRTPTATHAVQCQNRPATDQPWRNGMCGHTEYVVRGEK